MTSSWPTRDGLSACSSHSLGGSAAHYKLSRVPAPGLLTPRTPKRRELTAYRYRSVLVYTTRTEHTSALPRRPYV